MITKEAIEAGCAAIDRPIHPDDMERILTAAFAAMPGPAVKELEWKPLGRSFEADTPIGEFYAQYYTELDGEGWTASYSETMEIGDFPTAEAAKAAAQADYEARILSALTPAPDLASENERLPQDVINLVIAAREFWDVAMDESDESAELDSALEAFSSRVPYENEPEEGRAALERT